MLTHALRCIFIPFAGTLLGALGVFLSTKRRSEAALSAVRGGCAGVMTAAAVWSLLIPSMELAEQRGVPVALPAALGLVVGVLFFRACDVLLLSRSAHRSLSVSVFAVTVHNFPEGMAVGAICAQMLRSAETSDAAAALALALGIAVQNIPEGAIVSIPLQKSGMSKPRAFFLGALSGAVEPLGALLTMLAAGLAVPLLPYLLGFAAGAMLYAVIEEASAKDPQGTLWPLAFSLGFALMMSLDVLLS